MPETCLNITAVERDVGLSKDVLRVWERRYGFPKPERDANGERLYPLDQVERLRLFKRLMDQGHRPGRLMGATESEIQDWSSVKIPATTPLRADTSAIHEELITRIREHDAAGYAQALQQQLAQQGLKAFVQDTLAPLTLLVGQSWESGQLAVFEEHLFTELSQRVLRHAIGGMTGSKPPCILLTTLPDEQHALGLLMAESMMVIEGAQCIPLGPRMPLLSIMEAARAHRSDAVALSFSAAFPTRLITPSLKQLRELLPSTVALWAGGSGVARLAPLEGVQWMNSLEAARMAVLEWRQSHHTADA